MKVLVVEDDRAMRHLLRDVLTRAGHDVIPRPDARDVVAVAEREGPDAVILDKEIPGTPGLDALSMLRARLPSLPVIFITAFGGPQVAAEAVRRGAYRYVEKPFRVGTLLDALEGIDRRAAGDAGRPGPA